MGDSKILEYIENHSIHSYMNKLDVYTSHILYDEEDRLDITVKSGDRRFSPTWDLVNNYQLGKITQDQFISEYIKLLNRSYNQNKSAWDSLIRKTRVTLVCYCKPDRFCHRYILAEYLQHKLKAKYIGEIVGDYIIY